MTQDSLRRPWKQKQHKMAGKYNCGRSKSSYLVESFTLNSEDRVVSRKGLERGPDPSYSSITDKECTLKGIIKGSRKKVAPIDLKTLSLHFDKYISAVNLILERIYNTPQRAEQLGKKLSEYRGWAYTLLRTERDLCYQHNDELKSLVYERLHRNALEHAGRVVLADWTRRRLVNSALDTLNESMDDALVLLRKRRVPSFLIRKVRSNCAAVKNNGSSYHYTLGILRQLRLALDTHILEALDIKISWRGRQRKRVVSLLAEESPEREKFQRLVKAKLRSWVKKGYPFTVPRLRSQSLDFSASTQNATGQGYWFTLDSVRENEILLHLKLPPGIDGTHHDSSPYKSNTMTFRFLDWLPRASMSDRESAERERDLHRKEQLRFRAAKFSDMHEQLMNTIKFQHVSHNLSRLNQRRKNDPERIAALQAEAHRLKSIRRSAPPMLLLRGHRVILQIPFHSPNGLVSSKVLGDREYTTKAGADRGLRVPVALSVEKDTEFVDLFISVDALMRKRMTLRRNASVLQSEVEKKKNNWEKKRHGQSYPRFLLKKMKHLEATWRKIRRLDTEISRIIAFKAVWFCERHRVKKMFFEDLRSFQAHAGSKDLSWNLSTNLWGKVIETVRYMREALGHSTYSVWTVNPRYTSQTCHVCGERGVRVEDERSTAERKGGEYFYCSSCDEHSHADINAARNIIHVQDKISSAVPGRTA